MINTDYLIQIRDKNADRVIRELADKLVQVIVELYDQRFPPQPKSPPTIESIERELKACEEVIKIFSGVNKDETKRIVRWLRDIFLD